MFSQWSIHSCADRSIGIPHMDVALVTFCLALVLGPMVTLLWGTSPLSVSPPPSLAGAMDLLGQPCPTYRVFLIVVGFGTCVGLATWRNGAEDDFCIGDGDRCRQLHLAVADKAVRRPDGALPWRARHHAGQAAATLWPVRQIQVVAVTFVKAFETRLNRKPTFVDADAYHLSYELLHQAIVKAKSTDVAAVRGALSGLNGATIIGDIEVDFVPVAPIATLPFVAVTNLNLPAKTFQELVTLANKSPVFFGSAGNGSVNARPPSRQLLFCDPVA